jgi:hypothetical protein
MTCGSQQDGLWCQQHEDVRGIIAVWSHRFAVLCQQESQDAMLLAIALLICTHWP